MREYREVLSERACCCRGNPGSGVTQVRGIRGVRKMQGLEDVR